MTEEPRQPVGTGASVSRGFHFDVALLSSSDRISGVATTVLLVSLFLPWFGISAFGATYTESGLDAHGYLYIALLLSIVIIIYLLARAGLPELTGQLPYAHAPLLFTAGTANLLIVALAVLLKPGGPAFGWEIGSFLALVAAVVAILPFAIPIVRARNHV
jgi:hypothetical protein